MTLGPDAAQETLRKALSMGAARAVHLKADPIPFDNFAIAKALAAELQGGGYDLILFGKMSIDSSNGAVGPITAELLNLPCVTAASKLEVADGKGTARRELEGAAELLEFPLPAVVTHRRRRRASALSVAQGHHGGEEEAARGEARAARRRFA